MPPVPKLQYLLNTFSTSDGRRRQLLMDSMEVSVVSKCCLKTPKCAGLHSSSLEVEASSQTKAPVEGYLSALAETPHGVSIN